MDDPVKQLDNGLLDLSGFANQHFNLAMQFDIARYVQILADSVSDSELEKRTDTHCRIFKQVLWLQRIVSGQHGRV